MIGKLEKNGLKSKEKIKNKISPLLKNTRSILLKEIKLLSIPLLISNSIEITLKYPMSKTLSEDKKFLITTRDSSKYFTEEGIKVPI